jgi:hypothetical protein
MQRSSAQHDRSGAFFCQLSTGRVRQLSGATVLLTGRELAHEASENADGPLAPEAEAQLRVVAHGLRAQQGGAGATAGHVDTALLFER